MIIVHTFHWKRGLCTFVPPILYTLLKKYFSSFKAQFKHFLMKLTLVLQVVFSQPLSSTAFSDHTVSTSPCWDWSAVVPMSDCHAKLSIPLGQEPFLIHSHSAWASGSYQTRVLDFKPQDKHRSSPYMAILLNNKQHQNYYIFLNAEISYKGACKISLAFKR